MRTLFAFLVVTSSWLCVALPGTASGITRQQANSAARVVLRPDRENGAVVLFGLQHALGPHTVVDSSSGKAHRRIGRRSLGRRAWLFWEDLDYGADFEHPSVMLLIDARTGKVRRRKLIGWYPLVNGRRPAFLRSARAYASKRYVVYSRLGLIPGSTRPVVAAADDLGFTVTEDNLKRECLVSTGDRGTKAPRNKNGDDRFLVDFAAMNAFADKVHLKHYDSGSRPEDLTLTVNRVVRDQPCDDVLIFITGHGQSIPAAELKQAGRTTHTGALNVVPPAGGPAGIRSESEVKTEGGASFETNTYITPADLENTMTTLVKGGTVKRKGHPDVTIPAHPNLGFKFKLASCFSQRFADVLTRTDATTGLPANPNVKVVESSSSRYEFSYAPGNRFPALKDGKQVFVTGDVDNPGPISPFVNGDIHGLESWATTPRESLDLAGALKQAFADGAAQDYSRKVGLTHPGLDVISPDGGAFTHFGEQDTGGIPNSGGSTLTSVPGGSGVDSGPGKCTAGTQETQPVEITPPGQGDVAWYYVDTQIPRAAYYARHHSSGGCNHEDGSMQANIELRDADGNVVSWDYDYPPFPEGENGPTRARGGQSCSGTLPNGSPKSFCDVSEPSMGIPPPSEGYLSNGWPQDPSKYPTYAVFFAVSGGGGSGPGASLHASITWRPAP